jgi:hypothetical protein
MSKAPIPIVEQAQRLAASARMLPVDDAAKALEQAITVLQAAQAQVLVEGERSGELAATSGCRTVRSFAMSILRRTAGDASPPATPQRWPAWPCTWSRSPNSPPPTPPVGAHAEPAHHHPTPARLRAGRVAGA